MSEISQSTQDVYDQQMLAEIPLERTNDLYRLELGQTVMVLNGILKGVTGTVVGGPDAGHCVVSLDENSGITAKFPLHLLRPV